MRPGQIQLNELESAVLRRIESQYPTIHTSSDELHVLSRTYTGVGSFTYFLRDGPDEEVDGPHIDLGAIIRIPGVLHGLGAILFLVDGKPDNLEIFTYGDERWDGFDGFQIEITT